MNIPALLLLFAAVDLPVEPGDWTGRTGRTGGGKERGKDAERLRPFRERERERGKGAQAQLSLCDGGSLRV